MGYSVWMLSLPYTPKSHTEERVQMKCMSGGYMS